MAYAADVESIFIIFDRPSGPEAPRFIEVEDEDGRSISIGEWVELPDRDVWALKLPRPSDG
jgi:hypothetical protein